MWAWQKFTENLWVAKVMNLRVELISGMRQILLHFDCYLLAVSLVLEDYGLNSRLLGYLGALAHAIVSCRISGTPI